MGPLLVLKSVAICTAGAGQEDGARDEATLSITLAKRIDGE